jgi:hypothetical protein
MNDVVTIGGIWENLNMNRIGFWKELRKKRNFDYFTSQRVRMGLHRRLMVSDGKRV